MPATIPTCGGAGAEVVQERTDDTARAFIRDIGEHADDAEADDEADRALSLVRGALGIGGGHFRGHFEELLGVAKGFLGDALAGKHAADFAGAGVGRQFLDRGDGAAVFGVFFDEIVVIGEAGDLGQVRHADHLVRAGELLETPADGFRGAASDAGVDFVEDQRARGNILLRGRDCTQVLSARATRDSSPPEAILSRGFSSSPRLGAIRNATVSTPRSDHSAGSTVLRRGSRRGSSPWLTPPVPARRAC